MSISLDDLERTVDMVRQQRLGRLQPQTPYSSLLSVVRGKRGQTNKPVVSFEPKMPKMPGLPGIKPPKGTDDEKYPFLRGRL